MTRISFTSSPLPQRWFNLKSEIHDFWRIWGEFTLPLCILGLLSLLIEAMALSFPYFVSRIVAAFEERSLDEAYLNALSVSFIGFSSYILAKIRWNHYFKRVAAPINKWTRIIALEKTESKPLSYIDGEAEYIRIAVERGVNAVEYCLDTFCMRFLPMFVSLSVAITGIMIIDVKRGLITLVCAFAYFGISIIVSRTFLPAIKKLTEIENECDRRFYERIWNMVLIVMCDERYSERTKQAAEIRECNSTAMGLWNGYYWRLSLLREPIAAICFLALMLSSIDLVFGGKMSSANFILIMWFSSIAFASMAATTAAQRDFLEKWGHILKFIEHINTKSSIESGVELEVPERFENLRFAGVSFKHFGEATPVEKHRDWSLKDVIFTIERGTLTAVLGPSGAGKSTLFDLMRGSPSPTGGAILLNGQKLSLIDKSWWWKQVGYVPQKPKFWDASMVENILYGKRDATKEELIAAMKAARLYDEFYVTGRMNKSIGRDGCELSGGQKQRVAIARALIRSPSVLLLDEATTGLDTVNERQVLTAIMELSNDLDADGKRKYTIIVIAHKFSTAALADQVLLLNEGKLVAKGKHLELIDSSELYSKLLMNEMVAC